MDPAWHQAFWTIVVGAVCSVTCGVIGCYLVLRRLSLLGDAISHAILPGIVVAFLFSGQISFVPIFIGAMAIGILTAFLTQSLHSFGNVPEDASMGVVFTSLFALGVILINSVPHVDLDPDCVLYGLIEFAPLDTINVLGQEVPAVLTKLGTAFVGATLFVTLFWKELKIVSFDPQLATAMGISAAVVHYLLMGVVAGVTVASFEAVGSILVIAMLIVPAATAHLLTDRLGPMMAVAAVVAVISSILGYALAAFWNTSVAGMMAVVAGGQFALAVALAPRHGLASKWFHNLKLALRIAGEDVIARLYRAEEPSTSPHAGESVSGWVSRLTVPHLKRRGYVATTQSGDLILTDVGRKLGRSLVRAHRLWEAYLDENFDLPRDHLHEPAERLEHYLDDRLQEQLAARLSDPNVDPHGRAIPDPRHKKD